MVELLFCLGRMNWFQVSVLVDLVDEEAANDKKIICLDKIESNLAERGNCHAVTFNSRHSFLSTAPLGVTCNFKFEQKVMPNL